MAKYTKEFIKSIWEDKVKNNLTLKECKAKYGISNIDYWFLKYEFRTKKIDTTAKQKFETLKWTGEKITTEWQAYYLGLLLSDGYILPANGAVVVKLVNKDGEFQLLNYLNHLITNDSNDLKIYSDNYVLLRIYSTQFMENIKKLGVEANKTDLELHIPSMPKELIRHFIRGYFDGDGTVFYDRQYLKANICSPTIGILEEIQKCLNDAGIETAINVEIRKGKELKTPSGKISTEFKNMYRLYIRKKEALFKFKSYLYSDSTICLIRKYKVFYADDPDLTLNCKNFNVEQRIENEP